LICSLRSHTAQGELIDTRLMRETLDGIVQIAMLDLPVR